MAPALLLAAALTATSQAGGLPGASLSDWGLYVLVVAANAAVAGTLMVLAAQQQAQRRGDAAAHRAGGAGERGQARVGVAGRPDAVVHG